MFVATSEEAQQRETNQSHRIIGSSSTRNIENGESLASVSHALINGLLWEDRAPHNCAGPFFGPGALGHEAHKSRCILHSIPRREEVPFLF